MEEGSSSGSFKEVELKVIQDIKPTSSKSERKRKRKRSVTYCVNDGSQLKVKDENNSEDDKSNVQIETKIQLRERTLAPGALAEYSDDFNYRRSETAIKREKRLAKMSAYASNRLANESAEKRAERLARMSKYAAKRLANETPEQRAYRLARMSAYTAKRLAEETEEDRQRRLSLMSQNAAKRSKRGRKPHEKVFDSDERRAEHEIVFIST